MSRIQQALVANASPIPMPSRIAELAAKLKAAYHALDQSADDEAGKKAMRGVYAVETRILVAPIVSRSDIMAAIDLIF